MKMNNYLKVFLVIFAAFVFIVIAALVIIITRGGLITKEGIVETGVIRVEVEPEDTKFSIFLDGEAVRLQDKRINQVREGTYTVRIEAENYADWEKNVIVTPGLVVDLFVRLYPDNFSLEQITSTNIDKLFFSPNGEFAYYIVTDGESKNDNGIWELRLTQNQFIFGNNRNEPEKLMSLTPELSAIFAEDNYQIVPSEDRSRLLLIRPDAEQLIIDLTADNNIIIDLEEELGFLPSEINWLAGSNSLLIRSEGLLYEYNLANGISSIIKYLPNSEFPYTFGEGVVYFFDPLSEEIMVYQNQTTTELFKDGALVPELKNILNLHTASNNNEAIIFETEAGFYYYDIERSKLIEITDDAETFSFYKFSRDGNNALFLNEENKLFSLTTKKIAATSTITKKFTDTGLMLEQGDFVKYTPQSTHFTFYKAATKELSIIESDAVNSVTVLEEATIASLRDFMVNLGGDSLYILLEDQRNQSSANAAANIYSIDLEAAE